MTDKLLTSIYYDPKHSAGYSTASKLFKSAKLLSPDLTKIQVENWLKGQLAYTLHKPIRKKFPRNVIIASGVDENWQADLVDMQEFSKKNDNFKYILTVIDVLSKYAWAEPVKLKTGLAVQKAFDKIFNERIPFKIQTDRGKEFLNQNVKNLFKSKNIHHFTSLNQDVKCAIVERFNRTLRNRMFKYFTAKGTRRYIEILPELLKAYNNTIHSSTKKKPKDVSNENSDEVFYNIYGVSSKRQLLKKYKSKNNIKVGDLIRMPHKSDVFSKGYYPRWTDETFQVNKVIKNSNRTMYHVERENRSKIPQKLYPEQVQKINQNLYRIEDIKSRRYNAQGKLEYWVKWLGYPSTQNSWIIASDIINL